MKFFRNGRGAVTVIHLLSKTFVKAPWEKAKSRSSDTRLNFIAHDFHLATKYTHVG
jgi:hypothetical protein